MRARAFGLLVCAAVQASCALLGYDFDKEAPGEAGGASSASTGSGVGGAVACQTAADCPGADNGCMARSCTEQVCSPTFTPEGTPAGTQKIGDCKRVVCDGAGQAVEEDDEADSPVDGNECTLDMCDGGVPSNPFEPDGTGCGVDLQCVNGQCSGCRVPAQCGASTICNGWTCANGICMTAPLNEGTRCEDCKTCQRGACQSAPEGTPDAIACPMTDACGDDGTCNGVGGCRKALPGVPCSPAACVGDDEHTAFLCDGAGNCVDQGIELCAPYVCSLITGTCPVSCTGLADCVDSFSCNGTTCENCFSCSEWLGMPASLTPLCPAGQTDAAALISVLLDCACTSCASDCAAGLCNSPPSQFPACTACMNTECSEEKVACQADVGAH